MIQLVTLTNPKHPEVRRRCQILEVFGASVNSQAINFHHRADSVTTMKTYLPVLGWLLVWLYQASAQQPTTQPSPNALVDCGNDKVIVFDETASKDGRYTMGWTIRPKDQQPPVDWSGYNPKRYWDTERKYVTVDGDKSKDSYLLVNGVLDTVNKTFTPLPTKDPYPASYRLSPSAAWSDDQQGTCTGLFCVGAEFSTEELWLITIDAQGTHLKDLFPDVEKAAQDYVREREPKNYRIYRLGCILGTQERIRELATVFGDHSVSVHFSSGKPGSQFVDYDGYITFTLPQGTVAGITAEKVKVPSPP